MAIRLYILCRLAPYNAASTGGQDGWAYAMLFEWFLLMTFVATVARNTQLVCFCRIHNLARIGSQGVWLASFSSDS